MSGLNMIAARSSPGAISESSSSHLPPSEASVVAKPVAFPPGWSSRGTTVGVGQVHSVGKQTALSGKGRLPIDRRHVVSGRRRYDRRAMREHENTWHDDKAASRLAPKGDDGRFDLCVAMNGRSDWHDLE